MARDVTKKLPSSEMPLAPHDDQAALYAAVVRSAVDAVVTETLDATITGWNPAAERILGHAAGDVIGGPSDVIVPPDQNGEVREIVARVQQGDTVDPFESVRRHADGRLVELSVGVSPLHAPDGSVAGIAWSFRQIGGQRLAEARFRLVVEASPSGMVMIDPRGAIRLVNTEAERIFGYTRDELLGRSLDVLIPERLRIGHEDFVAGFRAAPAARPMGIGREVSGRRKDGSEFPAEIGLTPISTSNGLRVLACVVDITARREAEAAIADQNEQLRRSNAELEQFAYVASHDLQEPLRMVASYTQLLAERYAGRLDERADKYIRYAGDGAKRMQTLVRDLLVLSRLSAQQSRMHPVKSASVLNEVLEQLAPAIRDSQAEIEVGELPDVSSDESELAQIFQNLLSNAVKFRGEKPPRIRVTAAPEGDFWHFTVADNGIGVAPRYHDRIFHMFQRLHDRGKYDGSGIGLAIAKKIVERHHGRIWVESDLGEGATFHFTIPRATGDST